MLGKVRRKEPPAEVDFRAFRKAILPPAKPDIIQWLETNRTLRGAHAGPWRREWCKWAVEIIRACVDRRTRVVVVRGASQIAKTESLILNVWAYRTVFDPAPAMMVLPSQTAAQDFSHQRIETLINSCPPLKAVVSSRGTGPRTEGASTIDFKTYAGGFLELVGTLSASELSQVAVRDLYMTEVDRYAVETENKEGSPLHLAKLRQRIFRHTSKLVMECSPTIAGESRIELEYQAGSQEHYFLPCPVCGFEQELLKPGFDWESATYCCSNCGGSSPQKAWLSRVGSLDRFRKRFRDHS